MPDNLSSILIRSQPLHIALSAPWIPQVHPALISRHHPLHAARIMGMLYKNLMAKLQSVSPVLVSQLMRNQLGTTFFQLQIKGQHSVHAAMGDAHLLGQVIHCGPSVLVQNSCTSNHVFVHPGSLFPSSEQVTNLAAPLPEVLVPSVNSCFGVGMFLECLLDLHVGNTGRIPCFEAEPDANPLGDPRLHVHGHCSCLFCFQLMLFWSHF